MEVSTLSGARKGIPVLSFSLWIEYSPNVIYKARNPGEEIGDIVWH
jgi:hypothetical protein